MCLHIYPHLPFIDKVPYLLLPSFLPHISIFWFYSIVIFFHYFLITMDIHCVDVSYIIIQWKNLSSLLQIGPKVWLTKTRFFEGKGWGLGEKNIYAYICSCTGVCVCVSTGVCVFMCVSVLCM